MITSVMNEAEAGEAAADVESTPFARASSLFRFVQTRAPQQGDESQADALPRVKTYFPDDQTLFHSRLLAAREDRDPAVMLSEAGQFVESSDREPWRGSRFRGKPDALPAWLAKFDAAMRERRDRPSVAWLEKKLVAALNADDHLVADNQLQWNAFEQALLSTWRDLGDSVIAVSLWPNASAANQAQLVRAMRVIALLNRIVGAGWKPDKNEDGEAVDLAEKFSVDDIETTLVEALVLLPANLFAWDNPAAQSNGHSRVGRGDDPAREEPLLDESGGMMARTGGRRAALRESVDALSQAVRLAMHHKEGRIPDVSDVMAYLPRETAALVESLEISERQPATRAMEMLDEITHHSSDGMTERTAWDTSSSALAVFHHAPPFGERLDPNDWRIRLGDWEVGNLTRAPVVGDLHVVQQELLRYEAGEIADIENLMAKEKKGHTHLFKELRQQETFIEEEHEEEHTHDNQTTDRNEMERETKKESQSQASIEAGVTFSASYGPVKIGANTQASYAASSSDSNKVSSKYAKEVVDRAIDRVKDRRLEQRRVLTRQQTVDRNVHEFDNTGETPVVGIYQWVNKIYEAATFNYGVRMMLDMTIPEPAAYWQYAKVLDAAAAVNAKPPPPLAVTDPVTGSRELRASDIGELVDVAQLAATYRVAGLSPPPPRWITAGVALRNEADPPNDKWANSQQHLSTKTEKVKIAKGYEPAWYTGVINLVSNTHDAYTITNQAWRDEYSSVIGNGPDGTVLPGLPAYEGGIIGNNTLSVGPFIDPVGLGEATTVSHAFQEAQPDNSVAIGASGDVGEDGEIPVTVSVIGSPTYAAAVTIVCERTQQAYQKWQLEQYEAVCTHWEQWTSDFEAAVREAKAAADAKNTPSTSTNTALSGRVITDELRRQFLQMLSVPYIGRTAGMKPADLSDPTKPTAPAIDPPRAAVEGRVIEFVEQAFEWPEMAYHFYPYYWKPSPSWPSSMVLQDADANFTDFLRAGSARVVVPVRPGFEIAVCHHLGVQPVVPWRAGTPPIVDEEPYLSIAEEIKSSQTAIEKPVRIDTPWPVTLPTTLVILRDEADELPVFRLPTDDEDETP